MKKALFVIDVQNYFINKSNKNLPKKIYQYIKKNKKSFQLIIFTQFINSPSSSVYRFLNWKECSKPPSINIVEELKPMLKYGKIFSKSFYSALKIPQVNNLLKQYKIQEIHLCGLDADCCVLATAFDAFDQGYKVKVLKTLTTSSSKKNLNLYKYAFLIFKRNIFKN